MKPPSLLASACLFGALALLGALAGCQRSESLAAPSRTSTPTQATLMQSRLPIEGQLPALDATEWVNSAPLTRATLRGKVVLVEFWTYTCINWRRQLPYVRAWAEKYERQGLVVIGVHSPEFEFEKSAAKVRQAIRDIGIAFPIAIDSEHSIWEAFENQYWPALYFVDAQGRIRHHHFGEGDYERSEAILQELLADAGATGIGQELARVNPVGAELDADWANLRSSENYLGSARTEGFASPGGPFGRPRIYELPSRLDLNGWALAGEWNVQPDAVVLTRGPGKIAYRFHARDLHLVMGSGAEGAAAKFQVRLDGRAPGDAHGVDVNEDGVGVVNEPRMYQLIRQQAPIVDRDFEIEFGDAAARAFSFTFG